MALRFLGFPRTRALEAQVSDSVGASTATDLQDPGISDKEAKARLDREEQERRGEEKAENISKEAERRAKIKAITKKVLDHMEKILGNDGKWFKKEIERNPELFDIGEYPRIPTGAELNWVNEKTAAKDFVQEHIKASNEAHMKKHYR